MATPTSAVYNHAVQQGLAPIQNLVNQLYGLLILLAITVGALVLLSRREDAVGRIAGVLLEVCFPKFAPKRSRARLERAYKTSPAASEANLAFQVSTKPAFFSKAERTFFLALTPVATHMGLDVFPKVGLNDVFEDRPGAEPGQYARYSQQHIDYLLVVHDSNRIVGGIELDGPSHEYDRQRAKDQKKAAVFNAANIPLIRFYNQNAYTYDEIKTKLEDALGTATYSASVGLPSS